MGTTSISVLQVRKQRLREGDSHKISQLGGGENQGSNPDMLTPDTGLNPRTLVLGPSDRRVKVILRLVLEDVVAMLRLPMGLGTIQCWVNSPGAGCYPTPVAAEQPTYRQRGNPSSCRQPGRRPLPWPKPKMLQGMAL